MKRLAILLLLVTATTLFAQACPPGCTCSCDLDLLEYQCSTNAQPHFVLGDGTTFTEAQVPATFSVAGLGAQTTIGGATIGFTIGSSNAITKFVTSAGGQCVGTSGVHYDTTFPVGVVVEGRVLQLFSRNPLYCREPGRDLICFTVRGQTGPPFPPLACTPDRIERVCGVVS